MKTNILLCVGGYGCNFATYWQNYTDAEKCPIKGDFAPPAMIEGWQTEVISIDIPPRKKDQLPDICNMRLGNDPKSEKIDIPRLAERIGQANSIIIIGSMAGSTGGLLIPQFASLARMKQLPVSAILVLPFSFEGRKRRTTALQGSASMHKQADRVIQVDNNRCLSISPRYQTLLDGFNAINQHITYECSLILEQIDQFSSSTDPVPQGEP
jgi:hypothetical protein